MTVQTYHVWFSTMGRQLVIVDEVKAFILDKLRDIAREKAIKILEIEGEFDHLHLLVELARDQTLASVMHQLKGASARAVFERFPELRLDMESNSFGQKGYGRRYVPVAQIETVRRYIRTQSERPLRHE